MLFNSSASISTFWHLCKNYMTLDWMLIEMLITCWPAAIDGDVDWGVDGGSINVDWVAYKIGQHLLSNRKKYDTFWHFLWKVFIWVFCWSSWGYWKVNKTFKCNWRIILILLQTHKQTETSYLINTAWSLCSIFSQLSDSFVSYGQSNTRAVWWRVFILHIYMYSQFENWLSPPPIVLADLISNRKWSKWYT